MMVPANCGVESNGSCIIAEDFQAELLCTAFGLMAEEARDQSLSVTFAAMFSANADDLQP